ncbi:MAG: hypothetical protein CVU84_01200 [Firmicutes bacterium HGW-Firmicutes-1]|jgi:hypothetical protein|nr:MAG: hypothetical protein CVU84_01200 [Firmicutes bacterium HGW-Firmicutes-1]
MNKKDVLELRRRLNKNEGTFTKMSGCYVNGHKEILVNFNKTFLSLEDVEFFKYLDIAKKTLSGTIGNNLLELPFLPEEEKEGGKQRFLLGIKESKLKDAGLLDAFYQLIIDSYEYVGNYLIVAFHDAYDVMTKTSDNQKLDESEEVYEYLIVAICPVDLTKPGLGYLEDENRIGARTRDWVVGAPETAFIFPAFTDRSTDIHSVMFYTKNTTEPHNELMELVLGCQVKPTASKQKNIFQTIINKAVNDTEKSSMVFGDIQESLIQFAEEQTACTDSFEGSAKLTKETVREILMESGLPEEITKKIDLDFAENFGDDLPVIDHLIDKKVLAENKKRKVEKTLAEQVERLEEKLEKTMSINTFEANDIEDTPIDIEPNSAGTKSNYDVFLRVKPEKISQIKSQIIDGRRCIIIPMDENEHANVNGVTI